MGGMEAGEAASAAVVKSVESQALGSMCSRDVHSAEEQVREVRNWVHDANDQVFAALEKRKAKGGSTAVCVCTLGARLALAHVGDCRAYLIREEKCLRLTRDHSLAMVLVSQGEITEEQVRTHADRSKVTRSLGDRRPMPDYFVDTLEQALGQTTMELRAGDLILLCSDGVWEPLTEDRILSILAGPQADLKLAAEAIVNATLREGGSDNATALLLRCDG
jgi:protein phosphatase